MAECFRLDDAATFAAIIRGRCWEIHSRYRLANYDAANSVVAETPLLGTEILLGCKNSIIAWPDEIARVVADTYWDRRGTKNVQIRSSIRVWNFAQQLLERTQAEIEIEGRRVTPDWFLQSALAWESILALRELAAGLTNLIEPYAEKPDRELLSAETRAALGTQALQMLDKAELVVEAIPEVSKDSRYHRGF